MAKLILLSRVCLNVVILNILGGAGDIMAKRKISFALLNARFLPEKTIHFAAAIIDKDINEFKCYKNKQLNPELFSY